MKNKMIERIEALETHINHLRRDVSLMDESEIARLIEVLTIHETLRMEAAICGRALRESKGE